MQHSISIVSFLLRKPANITSPPTGEPEIKYHTTRLITDNNTSFIQDLITAEVSTLGPFIGFFKEDPTNTSLIFNDIIKNPPGSLALTQVDDSTHFTLWYVGEKVERGWVSKSSTRVLHNLGYYVVLSSAAPALDNVCGAGLIKTIDSATEQLNDVQKKIDILCEQTAKHINTIARLNDENIALKVKLDTRTPDMPRSGSSSHEE